MAAGGSSRRERLARRVAGAIFQKSVTGPILAVFTVTVSAIVTFGDKLATVFDLGGDVAAFPIRLVTSIGAGLIEAAARRSGLEAAQFEALAFVVGVAVAGIALYFVAVGVGLIE